MSEQLYYREQGVLPVNHREKPMTAAEVMGEAWVPVSERLPEVDKLVVGIVKGGYMEVMKMDSDGRWWCSDGWWSVTKMLYWMPLPEPPKEA